MKKKLKGLLSLWLAVVLVLGTPTVPVLAEGTSHHDEWKEMNSSRTELEDNYYLNGNVSLSNVVSVSTNCNVCLNNYWLNSESGYGGISVK